MKKQTLISVLGLRKRLAITCPSFTHERDVADCHLKDFNHVLDALRSAAERLSTSCANGHRYASLHALLLSWEGDDMGVATEVINLGNVLRDQYAFGIQHWEIPIKKSTIQLTKLIIDWTEEHEGEDKLLLVYYAGHGGVDGSKQALWSNRRNHDDIYADLKWSGCEEILHESVSDTLFLLDCCHEASSVSQARKGFSETIAASGFESIAPLPGPHSFTNALTRILFDWARRSQAFTVAALHAEILTYLKIIPPCQLSRNGLELATVSTCMEMRTYEWRRTPVHYIRSTYKYNSSIVLTPKSEPSAPFIDLNQLHTPKPADSPRVVLSISLTEDIRADDAESCRRWLTDFPIPIQDITVEAVFKSFSTVVFVSVPLEIWDILPEIPGCNFVCYAQSRNLLGIPSVPDSIYQNVTSGPPETRRPKDGQEASILYQDKNPLTKKQAPVPAERISSGKEVAKSTRLQPNLDALKKFYSFEPSSVTPAALEGYWTEAIKSIEDPAQLDILSSLLQLMSSSWMPREATTKDRFPLLYGREEQKAEQSGDKTDMDYDCVQLVGRRPHRNFDLLHYLQSRAVAEEKIQRTNPFGSVKCYDSTPILLAPSNFGSSLGRLWNIPGDYEVVQASEGDCEGGGKTLFQFRVTEMKSLEIKKSARSGFEIRILAHDIVPIY